MILLADVYRLLVDELDDGVRQVLLRLDLLGEVFGFDCLVHVDVHGQLVALGPFLGHAAELAGFGVPGDFDAGVEEDGLALLELALVLLGQLGLVASHG